MERETTIILGWEEWVALPELGLPAIKAKVDTGAKTSALHAHMIEPFGPHSSPMVRFAVHPRPGRTDIEVTCAARVVGRRWVTSSNGEAENRYVIRTRLAVGGREWPIEVTLSNRETMSYRMLLGREAIRSDVFVDPTSSFLQPRLTYKLYRKSARAPAVARPLRIGVLTRRPLTAANKRLARAARARGHVLETIDAGGLHLVLGHGAPDIVAHGAPLPHFDAVIARMAPRNAPFAAAAIRQFELRGSFALNPGDALDRLAAPLAAAQLLDAAAIPMASTLKLAEADLDSAPLLNRRASRLAILVVGFRAAGAIDRQRGELASADLAEHGPAVKLAERAARALGLGLAEIAIARRGEEMAVSGVSAMPPLAQFEAVTGSEAARLIIAEVERRVKGAKATTSSN